MFVRNFKVSVVLGLAGVIAACGSEQSADTAIDEEQVGVSQSAISGGAFPPDGATTTETPIGLALDIDNGVGTPLKVRRGQRFYINQIDMRAAVNSTKDEGVAGLDRSGDFASLDWRGTELVDESTAGQQNADGTWVRRRFYRKSRWMEQPSVFIIEQVDARGRKTGAPLIVDTGLEHVRTPVDSFFARRLRAIQWTNDCVSRTDCKGAHDFNEEALIELRYSNGPNPNFKIAPDTTGLQVTWSMKPLSPYSIPVEQVANPTWDYGFTMDLKPITPPRADGTYAPGTSVVFQFTLKDGAGKPLHNPGVLPSFNDYLSGNIESGIQYLASFNDRFVTYYRRKHREKQLVLSLSGPMQDTKAIYSVMDLGAALDWETGTVSGATPSRDGFYAAAAGIPSYVDLFTGPSAWSNPATDTWTFKIPADARAGTYQAVLKGRRVYLGQDIPESKVVEIQVGTKTHTTTPETISACKTCHSKGGELDRVLHGLDNSKACNTACHTPINFELEGPAYVRTHFVHSRTNRLDANLANCSNCHLNRASIQRTSKSACLSCHKSYPDDHVAKYGPIVDMFIGGREESFQQCTTRCHTNHPESSL